MKVLLINPPHDAGALERELGNYMPPLNLLYLASALRAAGHEPSLLDLYASPLPAARALELAAAGEPGLVGMAVYSPHAEEAFALAAALKRALPRARLALGGVHPSWLPEVCLGREGVDFVVRGEGERTLPALASALERGEALDAVAGLAFRREGKTVNTPPRALVEDLDELAPPAYDLLDFRAYRLAPTRAVTAGPVSSVLTSRGCPYACSFCSHHYGYKSRVRMRAPEKVVEEMARVVERYGVREFRIEDCSFTDDPSRVRRFCALLRARCPGVVWNCDVRADTASEELFADMRAAGCLRVFLGVESGSQRVLDSLGMNKDITLEQARRTVALARRHGMRINCSFVLGTPAETRETAEETYRFALELDPDYAMFSPLVPSVGSRLFEEAVAAGRIDPEAYQGANYLILRARGGSPVALSKLSGAELVELSDRFHRGFYGRPRYLLRRLLGIRSAREAVRLARGAGLVLRRTR